MKYLLFLLMFVFIFSFNSHAYTLFWFTGAGIKNPAKKIAAIYNKTHKNKVVIIAGGSGQVLNEMIESKKGDIYTLVDSIFLKKALRKKVVLKYKKLLKLTPVFVLSKSGKQKIKDFYDLANKDITIAGGNKKAMCLGKTFEEIMSKIPENLSKKMNKNIIIRCLNVFQIIGYAKENSVDAGIVLDKALIGKTGLKYVTIPKKYNVNRYGYLTLVSYSKHKKAANELFEFVWKHRNIYKQYGFNLTNGGKK